VPEWTPKQVDTELTVAIGCVYRIRMSTRSLPDGWLDRLGEVEQELLHLQHDLRDSTKNSTIAG
jgi:hypothetical protein